MMAIQDFNQPYEILWNTDVEGNPITVLIENESHTITDNMIILAQLPSESNKPTITGKYEVPLNSVLSSADYFKVDYRNGVIYFHSSLEGTAITINQYYGRGIKRLLASRVQVTDADNHYTSNQLELILKEIGERLAALET
ncbi:MAG: hypothetical protein GX660_21855 [Clostridiaceae bacterium]|nr:hypothetical protein [Clostridiaceae bacterium]